MKFNWQQIDPTLLLVDIFVFSIIFLVLGCSYAPALDSQGQNIHGLLSMSSSTELFIFYNISSVTQVESAIWWSFHLTKYWKYSCPWVLLYTFLSNILSSCNVSLIGNCFNQSTSCSSASYVLASIPSPRYLYK